MPSPNLKIYQPQFGGRNLGRGSSFVGNTEPIPASGIELTMFWLDRIAEQHGWTTNYAGNPLIWESGFVWKRHNGLELETFIPNSGKPYGLDGYPTNSTQFWEHFRDVIKFAGVRTMRKYENYGGYVSGVIANGLNNSGWTWGTSIAQWSPYGTYTKDGMTLTTSGIVNLDIASDTRYMGIPGKLAYEDYLQYCRNFTQPATLDCYTVNVRKTGIVTSGYNLGLGIYENDVPINTPPIYYWANGHGYTEHTSKLHGGSGMLKPQFTSLVYYINSFGSLPNTLASRFQSQNWNMTYGFDDFSRANISIIKEHNVLFSETPGAPVNNCFEPESGPIGGYSAYSQAQVSLEYDLQIPITITPLSRRVFASSISDVYYDDYNHYIREFTGWHPSDKSEIAVRYDAYPGNELYETSGIVERPLYFTQFFGYYWLNMYYCREITKYKHKYNYLGDLKVVYGYIDYNPLYNSGSYPFDQYNRGYFDIVTSGIINKIYSGDYFECGRVPSASGGLCAPSVHSAYGHIFLDDVIEVPETMNNSNCGSMSGVVDKQPTNTAMWFAIIPPVIDVSNFLLSSSGTSFIYPDLHTFVNNPPYDPNLESTLTCQIIPPASSVAIDDRYLYSVHREFYRSKIEVRPYTASYNTVLDSEHTSYLAKPSGQFKHSRIIGVPGSYGASQEGRGLFVVRTNTDTMKDYNFE